MEWEKPASPAPSLDSVDIQSPSMTGQPNNNNHNYPYGQAPNNGYVGGGGYNNSGYGNSGGSQQQQPQLRRRMVTPHPDVSRMSSDNQNNKYSKNQNTRRMGGGMKRLDFFQKVETDMTVKTERGAKATLIGYTIIAILIFAEILSWRASNAELLEHVVVDTSLGKKMRVSLNITFPALHCDDLHVDLMDVAGDAQFNVDEDTMVKRRLHSDGSPLKEKEIQVEMNAHHVQEVEMLDKLKDALHHDYCGPCYGAQDEPEQCCNTCDEVLRAYRSKKWNFEQVRAVSEQCKREGKTKPKRMTKGEGCNLSGYMAFNRVAGNFHIAMGEGVERDGSHVHTFQPDDAQNFNASHVIHYLRFGPDFDSSLSSTGKKTANAWERNTLDGVQKIVTEQDGSTGMFQYFLKVVPTTYKGSKVVNAAYPGYDYNEEEASLETNRYFLTEVFRPLMEVEEEHLELGKKMRKEKELNHPNDVPDIEDVKRTAGVHLGGKSGSSHDHTEHHKIQNAVLPGLFFIYQIYPFAIEVTAKSVPFTHLLIRITATIGGVMTIVGWIDSMLHSRDNNKSNRSLYY